MKYYLEVIKLVSQIILTWAILLYGWMYLKGVSDCIDFKAPRASLSLRYGVLCNGVVNGTEIFAPLSYLREMSGK